MYKIGLTLMVRARPDPITLARVSPCVDRDRARAASLAKTSASISLDFPENFRSHRRKLFAAPIRRLSREVVGRAERVCLSLFARVSASTTNRLTRSPFKYKHDPHDI